MADDKSSVDIERLLRAAEVLKHLKRRTYDLMHIQEGCRVLDVGCGPGIDTIALAQIVTSIGKVVGVDPDPAMLIKADASAHEAGVSRWVVHHQGDLLALPFEENRFDAVRCERIFQHLDEPERLLAEMIRVTKHTGWVVVADTDWASVSVDTPEVDIERRLLRVKAEQHIASGVVGRQLYRMMVEHKLESILIEPFGIAMLSLAEMRYLAHLDVVEQLALEEKAISEEELRRWQTSLGQAAAAGTFYAHGIVVVAAGKKP